MLGRIGLLSKAAFIVYCNVAAVPNVSITYLPQLNAINLTLLQYRTAVVGAETAFRVLLQSQRSYLQYTMH